MTDGDTGEWLPANTEIDARELAVGMQVFGSNGEPIGRIKQVRTDDFLVDRPAARDVYVPLTAIRQVGIDEQGLAFERRVRLDVPSGSVDQMDWPHPTL